LYYGGTGNGSYGGAGVNVNTAGVCGDTDVKKLFDAATAQTGNASVCTHNAGATTAATSYTVTDLLTSTQYFCVDSTGFAGEIGTTNTATVGLKCK